MRKLIYMSCGGQKARECVDMGQKIEILRGESNLPSITGYSGQDSFTDGAWSEDLDTLLEWLEDWVGGEFEYEVIDAEPGELDW